MNNNNNLLEYLRENNFHCIFSCENSLSCQYYDEDTFIKLNRNDKRFCNIFSLNIRSYLEMEENYCIFCRHWKLFLYELKNLVTATNANLKALKLRNHHLTIGGLYRHPSGNIKHFMSDLENSLEQSKDDHTSIIAGDLNIDIIQFHVGDVLEYITALMSPKCLPYIVLPTRISHHSTTCIDHIFVRNNPRYHQWASRHIRWDFLLRNNGPSP